jgi:AAA domain
VLIWINGPNGVGKTQVAFALRRRLPDSVVCDPEHLGFGLRRMLPEKLRLDFRDLPVWRSGVSHLLGIALAEGDGPVIAPMTVLDPAVLTELIAPLRAAGHDVHHVALLASRATLLRRIHTRGETSRSFAGRQIDSSLKILRMPEFARHLHTDGMSIGDVAENIASHAGLMPEPDSDGPVRRGVRRLGVQLRHIRFE